MRHLDIRPFQKPFIRDLLDPDVLTNAISLPRGNGKSTLVAWLGARTLTPGDPLFVPGTENYMAAASLGQSRRTTFKLLRKTLADCEADYKISDNATYASVLHRESGTRLSVIAANGRTAQGIVDSHWVICDEPGSWQVEGGLAMFEAIQTALGKPESNLRTIYVGTIAPGGTGGWWGELLEAGCQGSTRIHLYQASDKDLERWDTWPVIARCNPLMWKFAASRRLLLEERDKARADTRLKAAFLSYRLNSPARDAASVLLTVGDWKRVAQRLPPIREGRPVVGIDLGAGRAWSSAVGVWPSGRCEAVAICPGIPDIEAQEKRDRVHPRTYQRLVEQGSLILSEGLRVPPPGMLVDYIRDWDPKAIICDRFRLPELRDTHPPCPVLPRLSRWSEATADIRALRRLSADGPLSVALGSRALLQASLMASQVLNDDSGNTRLQKRGTNSTGRDDVCQGWVLAAGHHLRHPTPTWALVTASGSGEVAVI